MLSINDYDYHLPPELIAQEPLPDRDQSRLLLLDRSAGTMAHRHFFQLPGLLDDRDVLVVNNTQVFPARLLGRKDSGGRVEALLLAPPRLRSNGTGPSRGEAQALYRAAKPARVGQTLFFEAELRGKIIGVEPGGRVALELWSDTQELPQALAAAGRTPLPPYIRRPASDRDARRYQTVFASQVGAVAAPTAGLHFTPAVVRELEEKGVGIVPLTLHVGPGTFQPVRGEDYSQHRLAPEYFSLSKDSAQAINSARAAGKRILAVGTTSVRVLEAQYRDGAVQAGEGWCDLFIYPGHRFQVVEGLLTNFHLPKSTLLLLVSALAGRQLVFRAYEAAIAAGYRFYSYGDCMLIR